MAIEGLSRLQVYQQAQDLAQFIYQDCLINMPPEEKFGLTSQIKRAAASVPANIAEGYGRYYYQESIRFCYLARGSLMELSSHIDLAVSQGYISIADKNLVDDKMTVLLRLIHGYIKYLKQSKRGDREPGSFAVSEDLTAYLTDNQIDLDDSR